MLMDLLAEEPDPFQGRSTAREYLQQRPSPDRLGRRAGNAGDVA